MRKKRAGQSRADPGCGRGRFEAAGELGSTEDVADRALIATVFRHFPTKDALIEATLSGTSTG